MASNISPLAHVDPTAKLGDNVTIHPFAFIDADVEIGDGWGLMSYTSITVSFTPLRAHVTGRKLVSRLIV